MRKVFSKLLLLCLSLYVEVYALELDEKYPSYKYVFNEFDVDNAYIHNKGFQNFALKNETFLRGFYKRSLKRGKEVLPTIQGLLVGKGVSDLFIYLSMIESGFLSHAISPKKAVGLWQFMPATAKQYNLEVCNTYDERCDTTSATSAAIAYLDKLHRQFGKWYLAAMAYNCGEGCLQKAIRRAGTDELSILTDERLKYLPKETRDYIKKILLIAMIGENTTLDYPSYGSTKSDYIDVEVAAGTSLKSIAQHIKMDYSKLQKLNIKIKNGLFPNTNKKKKYTIRIPIEKVFSFYLQYELESKKASTKPHLLSHYVVMGETLESIAQKYDTSSFEIEKANNLKNEYLALDQFLVIPVSRKTFEKTLLGASK